MDPHDIMGVPRNFKYEDLRNNYRRMAGQLMSGTSSLSKEQADSALQTITLAFKTLIKEYNHRSTMAGSRVPHAGTAENGRYATPPRTDDTDGMDDETKRKSRANKYDMKQFNMIFEESRNKDAYDKGYEDWLKRSTFDAQKDEEELQRQQQMQSLGEPEPMQFTRTGKGSSSFAEIGIDEVNDFGKKNEMSRGGVQFTDLRVAHSTHRLLDPNRVQMPPEYSSLESLQAARSDARSMVLTPEQQKALELGKLRKSRMDAERLQKIGMYDERIQAHHAEVQRRVFGAKAGSIAIPDRQLPSLPSVSLKEREMTLQRRDPTTVDNGVTTRSRRGM